MDKPSLFDNKNRNWENILGNIVSIVAVSSILIPICLASLYVSILLIQEIIALF